MDEPAVAPGAALRRLLCAVALLGVGCSDSGGPTEPLSDCTGQVSITVSSGTTPTISWTPACRLSLVLVEPVNSGDDLWVIGTDSANAIAPPIVYGVTPPGARQIWGPTTLVTGQGYGVYVFRWTGPGKQDGVPNGQRTFTP